MRRTSRRFNAYSSTSIDKGVLFGASMAFALIVLGILFGGGSILRFLDVGSLMIVFGGTIGAVLINFSPLDLRRSWAELKGALIQRQWRPDERMKYLVQLAQVVKREGMLHLDNEASRVSDPFLKLALQITVDGQGQEDVRRILETEMRSSQERASRAVQVFETMGSYAPAMGLIGTLIGLIQMLGSLSDPSSVGPAMAVALVTTFYGAVLANLICFPVAGKIRNRSEEEAIVKAITIEGIQSLARQESSIILEQRLRSFLPMAA